MEININADGSFIDGKIHSFLQTRGIGPREDAAGSVAREIRHLSNADIPQSQATIDAQGNIRLK